MPGFINFLFFWYYNIVYMAMRLLGYTALIVYLNLWPCEGQN